MKPLFPPYTAKTVLPIPGTPGSFLVLSRQYVTRPLIQKSWRRYKGSPIVSQETVELEPVWSECHWVEFRGAYTLRQFATPGSKVELKNVLAWMPLPSKSPED